MSNEKMNSVLPDINGILYLGILVYEHNGKVFSENIIYEKFNSNFSDLVHQYIDDFKILYFTWLLKKNLSYSEFENVSQSVNIIPNCFESLNLTHIDTIFLKDNDIEGAALIIRENQSPLASPDYDALQKTFADTIKKKKIPHLPTYTNPQTVYLSTREKECLSWSAFGKTAAEISKILNIEISTVNFHIKKAKKKLLASNIQEAITKALLLKLLPINFDS